MSNFVSLQINSGKEEQVQSSGLQSGTPPKMTMDMGTGQVRQGGAMTVYASEDQPGLNPKTDWGSNALSIEDDTIITVGGFQMRADIAARQGLIQKDASGRYL